MVSFAGGRLSLYFFPVGFSPELFVKDFVCALYSSAFPWFL